MRGEGRLHQLNGRPAFEDVRGVGVPQPSRGNRQIHAHDFIGFDAAAADFGARRPF